MTASRTLLVAIALAVASACNDNSNPTDSTTGYPLTKDLGIFSVHPNEPGGMTTETDYPFTNLPPLSPSDDGGWTRFTTANASVLSEATAGIDSGPESPGSVFRGTWPPGANGGSGPFNVVYPVGGNRQRLYLDFYLWLDTGFSNDGNTGTKLAFLAQNDGHNHYLNLTGGSTLSGSLGINLQGNGLNRNMPATYSFATNRGKWIRVEVLLVANEPDSANGSAEVWVDGTKKLDKHDVEFFDGGSNFDVVKLNPTYGGGSNKPGIRGTGGNGSFSLDTGVNAALNASGSEVGRTYEFFTGHTNAIPGTSLGTATITSNTTTTLSFTGDMTGAVRAIPQGGLRMYIDNMYISVSD